MSQKEQFLSQRQRYRPITLPQEFSDEEMFRDWQLSKEDCDELKKYQKRFRLHLAIQICGVRLYGRFISQVHDLSPRISHLRKQLDLPPALKIRTPEREATYIEQLQNILKYLKKAVDVVLETSTILLDWLDEQPLSKADLWQQVDEIQLRSSLEDLRVFKQLEERGYADLLIDAYPTLRKYFAEFIQLPFAAAPGSEKLMQAIEMVR